MIVIGIYGNIASMYVTNANRQIETSAGKYFFRFFVTYFSCR